MGKRKNKIVSLILLVAAAGVFSCGGGGSSTTATTTTLSLPLPKKKWTVAVIMNGDNDLEEYALYDFLEMSQIGSSSDVNIVVLMDRNYNYSTDYGDWDTCKIFYVKKGMTPTPDNAIADWGECNLGSSYPIEDFLYYVKDNFPADRYALIVWGHGQGWKSINVPATLGRPKIAGYDETDGDYLYNYELQNAIENSNLHLNVLGFDECVMGMMEVAYQFKNDADVLVASEDFEYGNGWDYATIFYNLVDQPDMDSYYFGALLTWAYENFYQFYDNATLTAFDLSKIDNLTLPIQDFVSYTPMDFDSVNSSLANVKKFYYDQYLDFYGFFKGVANSTSDETLRYLAQEVLSAYNDTIVRVVYDGNDTYEARFISSDLNGTAYGMSIYFPAQSDFDSDYTSNLFSVDTGWGDFVQSYYGWLINQLTTAI